jgi:hypothetical protein
MFPFSITSRPALASYPTGVAGALPTPVKLPGFEGDHSPSSITEVRNDGATPPFLRMCSTSTVTGL